MQPARGMTRVQGGEGRRIACPTNSTQHLPTPDRGRRAGHARPLQVDDAALDGGGGGLGAVLYA